VIGVMRRNDSRCSWSRLLLAVLALFALSLSARSSLASSSYPNRMKSRWGISGTMPGGGQDGCLLCHSKETGGTGTATRSFAVTLRTKYGLAGADIDSLDSALAQSKKNQSDSDRDTFSDYEELATFNTDPNDAKSHPAPVETGTGGEAGASNSSGGTSATGGSAATGGAGGGSEEPEPSRCGSSGPSLPIAEYGCQFRGAPGREVSWLLALICGASVTRLRIRRRVRRAPDSG
jgi:hypothetical protein